MTPDEGTQDDGMTEADDVTGDSDCWDARDTKVGHRRPPASTRFAKGQSGNPKGRPRGVARQAPYEAVLG